MAEIKSVIQGRDISTYISPLGASKRAYYDIFDNFKDITDYTRKVEQDLVAKNKNWKGRRDFVDGNRTPTDDFQGSTDVNLLNDPTQITDYLYQDVLERELDNLASITQNLKLGAGAKKTKLEFTEQPTGIFNFGMASKGLYRKREFFCPELNMVVDENLVTNENGTFWYKGKSNDINSFMLNAHLIRYKCELRQEGTTEMLLKNPNAKVLKAADGMLYTDPIRFEDVSLKFATSTKKVYLKKSEIKNVTGGGNEKYVDVYITANSPANINKENFIYGALPSILLVQILEKAGFKVRVNKVICNMLQSVASNTGVIFYAYSLKDYGEPINYQRIAIDAADPRLLRFEDFRKKGILVREIFNQDLTNYGYTPDENQVDRIFIEYKHWLNKEIRKGTGKKIFNKNLNLHLLGTITKSNDSHTIQMQRVVRKLKEMLDRVAIEFVGSEQAIKDALERDLGTINKPTIIANFEAALRKTQPIQPLDRDLQLPDAEFQQKLTNYQNNLTKFNQIRPTL
jgi:hypothetical protein